MQAYHSGDPQYYAQPQAAYYGQYAPYPSYHPAQTIATPFPTYPAQYDSPPAQHPLAQHPTPGPIRKNLSHGRSASSAPTNTNAPSRSGTPAAPLKSAMKKPPDRAGSIGAVPLARRSTNESRQRVNSLTRPKSRTNSISGFVPDHLFVSIYGGGELRIDNLAYQSTLDDLRELVLPMWPHGVELEDSRGDNWRVRFAGSPWTSVGLNCILAQRLICSLYGVLARQGYAHLTTIQTGNSRRPSKLVFAEAPPDPEVKIFATMFNPSKMRLTLLDAPLALTQDFTASLRPMFPRKVMSYGANEDGVHVIEVKRDGFRGNESERNLFHGCMLRFFNSVGFKLDGSIPLGRTGPMFMSSRKEVWIFRSMPMRRPESRQSRHKQS